VYDTSFTPQCGASGGALNATSFICNPFLIPVDTVFYEGQYNATAVQNYFFPPMCMTGSANTQANGWPIGDGATNNLYSPIVANATLSSSGTQFGWRSRVHGFEIDIEYTGTELDKGGLLYIYHGASGMALTSQNVTANSTYASFTTPTSVTLPGTGNFCTAVRIGNRAKFVLRPTSTEWKDLRTHWFSGSVNNLVSFGNGNQLIDAAGVLPLASYLGAGLTQVGRPTRFGHTMGFTLVPANPNTTAGGVQPYIVRVRAVLDVDIWNTGQQVNQQFGMPIMSSHADPVAHAHIHNALAAHNQNIIRGSLRDTIAQGEHGLQSVADSVADAASLAATTAGVIF
jgi:hypothetical protein